MSKLAKAAIFFAHNGERSGFVVFDMKEASQIPIIAEPLFVALNAKVEIHPVMNLEDVRKGLSGGGSRGQEAPPRKSCLKLNRFLVSQPSKEGFSIGIGGLLAHVASPKR